MVAGVTRFHDHVAVHEKQYVLICGGACKLVMDEAGLDFRATKDLDIVLSRKAMLSRFYRRAERSEYGVRWDNPNFRTIMPSPKIPPALPLTGVRRP